MNEKEKMKRDINVPCKMAKDRYTGVDCSYNCKSCGWNPAERERRFSTGRIVEKYGVRKLVFTPV